MRSPLLNGPVLLAPINRAPLVLWFNGLLDRAEVHFSVPDGEAYLELLVLKAEK